MSGSEHARAIDRDDLLPLLLVAAAGVLLFAASYGRWLEPIVDTGRDLYIPGKLLDGQKLYRDILYYYPPLVPYLLAALTAVLGRSLAAYTAIGAATAAVTALTLYATVKLTAGRLAAFVAALLFVGLNFTCNIGYGSNYLFPYAHGATFGMTFLLLFIFFAFRFVYAGRAPRDMAAAVAFAVLASWCKVELALLCTVSMVLLVVIHRVPKRWLAIFAGAMLLAAGSAALFFADAPPGHHWLRDNIFPSTFVGGPKFARFYANVIGLPRWRARLLESLAGAAIVVAFAACLAALDRTRHRLLIGVELVAAAVLIAFGADLKFFQAWTILQIVLIPFALAAPRARLAMLLFFSLAGSARIFLKLAPAWYGFVLIVPAYLLISHVLFEELPSRGVYSRRASLLWVAFLLVLIGRGTTQQRQAYLAKSAPVVTRRGTFFETSQRAAVLNGLIGTVERSGARSLVVMPEGVAINYLSGVDTPLSYTTFTPIEAGNPIIENAILRELGAKPPELIALVSRSVGEFGYRGFGVDYDLRLAGEIKSRYATADGWRSGGAWAILLKRR